MNAYQDQLRRGPDELLDAWPTLPGVAAAAAAAGVRVTVLQAAAEDAERAVDGARILFVRERAACRWRRRAGLRALPLPRRVVAHARRLRPDVLHLHGLSFPLHARFLARRLPGVPILAQDHADRPPRRALLRALHRRGLASVAGVAFTAREQAQPFLDAGLLSPDMPVFEVLESSTRFEPGDPAAARAVAGIHGDPCLLWLGRLDANKDPLTALEALARAAARLTDPHLWCCYLDAPLIDDVRRRIAADPILAGRVHLLGPQPHGRVELLLRAADFLIQASHSESCGYAAIEALACGATPLVTDIPALRRITGRGRAGALSPPGDPAAMARALLDWAGRDRATLRRAARAHFERHLSFDALGRELVLAYQLLVAGDRGDASAVPLHAAARRARPEATSP